MKNYIAFTIAAGISLSSLTPVLADDNPLNVPAKFFAGIFFGAPYKVTAKVFDLDQAPKTASTTTTTTTTTTKKTK
jgi:hypothetical protein